MPGPLLDTHAALWWLSDDERLSETAREEIASAERPLLGAGTLFEVSVKASIGKLEVPGEWIEELLEEGFELLPITPAHAARLRSLSFVRLAGKPHRDPFDRLLVAQALVEQTPIVTRDPGITGHEAATIW